MGEKGNFPIPPNAPLVPVPVTDHGTGLPQNEGLATGSGTLLLLFFC